MLLLLVHEMGHVIQLRREGIEASAPMFIPFLGAVSPPSRSATTPPPRPGSGSPGPILGTLATLVPLGIWLATGEEFWQALAYVGFFINLFNLLPVLPLDGGRAMAALSPWVWFAGFAGLVALTFAFPNPILILVLLLGGFESWHRWKNRNTPEAPRLSTRSPPAPGRWSRSSTSVSRPRSRSASTETFLEKSFDDV